GPPAGTRLLLTHYMPWFQAPPTHPTWGWHWTMNHFHPERLVDGKREAASHHTPLIGLYDSDDADVLECQVLLMKLAGIDGVLIDWYGTDDFLDYAQNHRSALHLIQFLKKAGLKYAFVYEDQTVPKLIEARRLPETEAVEHGRKLLQWLQEHAF